MIDSYPIEVQLSADMSLREVTFYGGQFGNRDGQAMRCMPGCFQQTFNTRLPQGLLKFCRNHQDRSDGLIIHAEEDSFGPLMVAKVSKTRSGDEILAQIEDGSLRYCSFRGSAVRAEPVIDGQDADGLPIVTLNLLEIKMKEAGPVDFEPANMGAHIVAMKSLGPELLDDLRELPYLLKIFTAARHRSATSEEKRLAKGLLTLREALEENDDLLKALLAPGSATPLPAEAAPAHPTRAGANGTPDLEISEALRTLARNRGRLL